MNDPSAHKRRSRKTSGRPPFEGSSSGARDLPRLVLVLELEEHPVARIEAMYESDEIRLRSWLSQDLVRRRVVQSLEDVLDELRPAA
jgi:hypothetical protein